MPVATRECFTVDLRGLRAALAARAARDGSTESYVLRSALAMALGTDMGVVPIPGQRLHRCAAACVSREVVCTAGATCSQ